MFPTSKIRLKISRRQKGDNRQVLDRGPTNTERQHTNISRRGNLAPGICAPLLYRILISSNKYRLSLLNGSLNL
jgi:hypothetical protein